MESKNGPIGQRVRGTRPGEMQPDGTKVRALRIPTDVHHPNPQGGLVEITTGQANKIARTGGRAVSLVNGPD